MFQVTLTVMELTFKDITEPLQTPPEMTIIVPLAMLTLILVLTELNLPTAIITPPQPILHRLILRLIPHQLIIPLPLVPIQRPFILVPEADNTTSTVMEIKPISIDNSIYNEIT